MKVQIPDELKRDLPQTQWGKLLSATPVIMTVVATLLAGLASSEMTRAQYNRSLGAQQQAKAGDQWGYFQAKRLRGAMQRSTLDLLQTTAELHPPDAEALAKLDPAAAAALQKGEPPAAPAGTPLPPAVKTAAELFESSRGETEVNAALASVTPETLIECVRAASERADAFDALTKPVNQAIDAVEKSLLGAGNQPRLRDFTAARLRYATARYDAESRLNQNIAELIELQVRKSNLIAERHHRRSQRFFFGMLGAQAAVIVSTFSLAARNRSMLWTLAATAGLAAIGFAVWVYFYV
jgi:Domain of unknown function (DUF4337)